MTCVTTILGIALSSVSAWANCTVYQHRDYGGAHWTLGSQDELQMGGGEPMGKTGGGRINYRPDWNDQISSFRVTQGCTITLWQHAGTSGYGARFRSSSSYSYVGGSWNDQASWAYCSCRR
jgi:hypothetical protein